MPGEGGDIILVIFFHIPEEYERSYFLPVKGWHAFLLSVTSGKVIIWHLMFWEMKQNDNHVILYKSN